MYKSLLKYSLILICLNCFGLLSANDLVTKGKDKKSGVKYNVTQNEDTLYFEFEFSGPIRLRQVAQNGFSLMINENGKKKAEKTLIVDGASKGMPPMGGMLPPGFTEIKEDNKTEMPKMPEMPLPDFEIFPVAKWNDGSDQEEAFDLENPESPFKASYSGKDSVYTCRVQIPINFINPEGIKKMKKLTIGFLSENSMEMGMPPMGMKPPGAQDGGGEGGNMMGGGPGGMGGPGGGGGPGGMGGPGGGGGRQGPPPGMQGGTTTNQSSNEISLWFKCK